MYLVARKERKALFYTLRKNVSSTNVYILLFILHTVLHILKAYDPIINPKGSHNFTGDSIWSDLLLSNELEPRGTQSLSELYSPKKKKNVSDNETDEQQAIFVIFTFFKVLL